MPVGRGEGFDLKDEWEEFRRSKIFKPTPKFDLGIVCSFGYMIPTYIIEAFTHGLIVIHPSLLPRHRGASPIQYALLQNDKVTGVSFIEISKKKFDAGKILL
jgi:methionyl-tRNA formyltransferase